VSPDLRPLVHFTPLRYPGGKGRLAPFVKAILEANKLLDGDYIEPFAGGAGVALELLFHEYVAAVHINDLSRPVYAFWKSVLDHTEEMCRLIHDTPLTVDEWDRQRATFRSTQQGEEDIALGFAFFFLNRTNRSGILNGGVIGGRDQTGPWKIDARYNAKELVRRVEAIARLRHRIHVTNEDAAKFISAGSQRWPLRSLIYCDPPYFVKGRELYYNYYEGGDHADIARLMGTVDAQRWIVSYDNVPAVQQLYERYRSVVYDIGYSARSARQGSEVMFFSSHLAVPPIVGAIVETDRREPKAA
jgi:DNA adenine methylase